jgi:hypothetical protein
MEGYLQGKFTWVNSYNSDIKVCVLVSFWFFYIMYIPCYVSSDEMEQKVQ